MFVHQQSNKHTCETLTGMTPILPPVKWPKPEEQQRDERTRDRLDFLLPNVVSTTPSRFFFLRVGTPNAAASAGACAGGATGGAVMERRQEEVRKEDRSSVGQTESWRAEDKRRRRDRQS